MDAAAAGPQPEADDGEAREQRDAGRAATSRATASRKGPGRAEADTAEPARGMLVIRHGIYEVRTATG